MGMSMEKSISVMSSGAAKSYATEGSGLMSMRLASADS